MMASKSVSNLESSEDDDEDWVFNFELYKQTFDILSQRKCGIKSVTPVKRKTNAAKSKVKPKQKSSKFKRPVQAKVTSWLSNRSSNSVESSFDLGDALPNLETGELEVFKIKPPSKKKLREKVVFIWDDSSSDDCTISQASKKEDFLVAPPKKKLIVDAQYTKNKSNYSENVKCNINFEEIDKTQFEVFNFKKESFFKDSNQNCVSKLKKGHVEVKSEHPDNMIWPDFKVPLNNNYDDLSDTDSFVEFNLMKKSAAPPTKKMKMEFDTKEQIKLKFPLVIADVDLTDLPDIDNEDSGLSSKIDMDADNEFDKLESCVSRPSLQFRRECVEDSCYEDLSFNDVLGDSVDGSSKNMDSSFCIKEKDYQSDAMVHFKDIVNSVTEVDIPKETCSSAYGKEERCLSDATRFEDIMNSLTEVLDDLPRIDDTPEETRLSTFGKEGDCLSDATLRFEDIVNSLAETLNDLPQVSVDDTPEKMDSSSCGKEEDYLSDTTVRFEDIVDSFPEVKLEKFTMKSPLIFSTSRSMPESGLTINKKEPLKEHCHSPDCLNSSLDIILEKLSVKATSFVKKELAIEDALKGQLTPSRFDSKGDITSDKNVCLKNPPSKPYLKKQHLSGKRATFNGISFSKTLSFHSEDGLNSSPEVSLEKTKININHLPSSETTTTTQLKMKNDLLKKRYPTVIVLEDRLNSLPGVSLEKPSTLTSVNHQSSAKTTTTKTVLLNQSSPILINLEDSIDSLPDVSLEKPSTLTSVNHQPSSKSTELKVKKDLLNNRLPLLIDLKDCVDSSLENTSAMCSDKITITELKIKNELLNKKYPLLEQLNDSLDSLPDVSLEKCSAKTLVNHLPYNETPTELKVKKNPVNVCRPTTVQMDSSLDVVLEKPSNNMKQLTIEEYFKNSFTPFQFKDIIEDSSSNFSLKNPLERSDNKNINFSEILASIEKNKTENTLYTLPDFRQGKMIKKEKQSKLETDSYSMMISKPVNNILMINRGSQHNENCTVTSNKYLSETEFSVKKELLKDSFSNNQPTRCHSENRFFSLPDINESVSVCWNETSSNTAFAVNKEITQEDRCEPMVKDSLNLLPHIHDQSCKITSFTDHCLENKLLKPEELDKSLEVDKMQDALLTITEPKIQHFLECGSDSLADVNSAMKHSQDKTVVPFSECHINALSNPVEPSSVPIFEQRNNDLTVVPNFTIIVDKSYSSKNPYDIYDCKNVLLMTMEHSSNHKVTCKYTLNLGPEYSDLCQPVNVNVNQLKRITSQLSSFYRIIESTSEDFVDSMSKNNLVDHGVTFLLLTVLQAVQGSVIPTALIPLLVKFMKISDVPTAQGIFHALMESLRLKSPKNLNHKMDMWSRISSDIESFIKLLSVKECFEYQSTLVLKYLISVLAIDIQRQSIIHNKNTLQHSFVSKFFNSHSTRLTHIIRWYGLTLALFCDKEASSITEDEVFLIESIEALLKIALICKSDYLYSNKLVARELSVYFAKLKSVESKELFLELMYNMRLIRYFMCLDILVKNYGVQLDNSNVYLVNIDSIVESYIGTIFEETAQNAVEHLLLLARLIFDYKVAVKAQLHCPIYQRALTNINVILPKLDIAAFLKMAHLINFTIESPWSLLPEVSNHAISKRIFGLFKSLKMLQ